MTDEQRKQFIEEQIEIFPADCEMGEFLRDMAKLQPCEDAISRVAAIDKLDEWDWQELYLPIHFKQLLENLPSVSTEKTGQWIPVSERLPVEYGTYLICTDDGYVSTIIYDRSMGWLLSAKIIAWMPLPQPYKAESEDKE